MEQLFVELINDKIVMNVINTLKPKERLSQLIRERSHAGPTMARVRQMKHNWFLHFFHCDAQVRFQRSSASQTVWTGSTEHHIFTHSLAHTRNIPSPRSSLSFLRSSDSVNQFFCEVSQVFASSDCNGPHDDGRASCATASHHEVHKGEVYKNLHPRQEHAYSWFWLCRCISHFHRLWAQRCSQRRLI